MYMFSFCRLLTLSYFRINPKTDERFFRNTNSSFPIPTWYREIIGIIRKSEQFGTHWFFDGLIRTCSTHWTNPNRILGKSDTSDFHFFWVLSNIEKTTKKISDFQSGQIKTTIRFWWTRAVQTDHGLFLARSDFWPDSVDPIFALELIGPPKSDPPKSRNYTD